MSSGAKSRSSSAGKAPAQKRSAAVASPRPRRPGLTSLPKEKLPGFISPQLATQALHPPDAHEWLHELKLDGYRIQAIKSGARIRMKTRKGLDWTHRFSSIAAEVATLPARDAIFDGEVVALDDEGLSSFARLQASFQEHNDHPLTYYVFDLLHLDGHNLRNLPLIERKQLLSGLLPRPPEHIRLSEHIQGNGQRVFNRACGVRAEGIVSKLPSGTYRSGRSTSWLKIKCKYEQEFVIGGFTPPSNGSHGIGALLLGYYDDHRHLIYAGRTGTGFNRSIHRMLRDRLDNLRIKRPPFTGVPQVAQRNAFWVRPTLVAQISFATWTSDLLVRQAAFKGLREDKPATEVRREAPISNANR